MFCFIERVCRFSRFLFVCCVIILRNDCNKSHKLIDSRRRYSVVRPHCPQRKVYSEKINLIIVKIQTNIDSNRISKNRIWMSQIRFWLANSKNSYKKIYAEMIVLLILLTQTKLIKIDILSIENQLLFIIKSVSSVTFPHLILIPLPSSLPIHSDILSILVLYNIVSLLFLVSIWLLFCCNE